MRHVFALATMLLATLSVSVVGQQIVFVDSDAPPGGNGVDWSSAFDDLQDALAAAPDSSEIWVAEGVYTPGPPGDEVSTFTLRSTIGLYGGFAGNETARDQRDWQLHETVLSGDVGRDDIYGGGQWNIVTGNSEHVVTADGVDATAILDGFVVEAGHSAHAAGAGLYSLSGSATIRNCRFDHNVAGFSGGGGAYVGNGHVTFASCSFIGNWSHLLEGGGLYIGTGGTVTATDCTFANNTATGSGREGAGGAVANWGNGFNAARSTFTGNVARGFWPENDVGGYGGAIHHFSGMLTLDSCLFENNWSNNGGAIWTWNDALIVNSVFRNNDAPDYPHNVTDWGGNGGAIGAYSFQSRLVTIVNSVFVGNDADKGGGINLDGSVNGEVSNSIFWANTDRAGNVGPSQIRGTGAAYSCIQNMLIGEDGEDPPDPDDFPHSIDLNPMFANLTGGDFHLTAGSPCIDAGDNLALPGWATIDFDGLPRRLDDPNTSDTGNGQAPIVDMGAFEFGTPTTTELVDMVVLFGHYVSGGLSDLLASDDTYVVLRSQFGFSVIEPDFEELLIGAVTDHPAPASITFSIESRINNPGGLMKVRVRNWQTGQLQQVGSFAVPLTDTTVMLQNVDATDRVRASDRRIELSLRTSVAASFSAMGYLHHYDHIRVEVD